MYDTIATCAGRTSKTPSLMGKLFVQVYVTPGTTDSKRIEVEGPPHHEGSESSFSVPIFRVCIHVRLNAFSTIENLPKEH